MAVNPTPQATPTGTLGETELFLHLPTINPVDERQTRDNWQFIENWANRLPKPIVTIVWFGDEDPIPGDGTETLVATIRLATGVAYIVSPGFSTDPTLTLSYRSDPAPYGVNTPAGLIAKWTGKQGYIDVKFYVSVTTSGSVDWPGPLNFTFGAAQIQGNGSIMAPLPTLP